MTKPSQSPTTVTYKYTVVCRKNMNLRRDRKHYWPGILLATKSAYSGTSIQWSLCKAATNHLAQAPSDMLHTIAPLQSSHLSITATNVQPISDIIMRFHCTINKQLLNNFNQKDTRIYPHINYPGQVIWAPLNISIATHFIDTAYKWSVHH